MSRGLSSALGMVADRGNGGLVMVSTTDTNEMRMRKRDNKPRGIGRWRMWS